MKCAYPISTGNKTVPCRQCMPCRINHKRVVTGKILMEMYSYKTQHRNVVITNPSSFVTLTYDDDHLPKHQTLVKEDLVKFIDKVRKSSLGHFRYYAVGEYGDKTQRPHYHLALFNVDPIQWEDRIREKWKKGFVHVGELSPESAGYIAGYCTKKMTNPRTWEDPNRIPEFARMSQRPPLGAAKVNEILDYLHTEQGSKHLALQGDVPKVFKIRGKTYPLSPYWVKYLRDEIGITAPPTHIADWCIEDEQTKKDEIAARQKHEKLYRRQRNTSKYI
jgi:hypothetical protein